MHASPSHFSRKKASVCPASSAKLHFMQPSIHFSHLHKIGRSTIKTLPFRHPLPKLSGPGGNARAFFCLRAARQSRPQFLLGQLPLGQFPLAQASLGHPPLHLPPLQTGTTLPTFHSVGIIRKGFPWQMQTQ